MMRKREHRRSSTRKRRETQTRNPKNPKNSSTRKRHEFELYNNMWLCVVCCVIL